MNSASIRRISLAVVIGLGRFVVSLALIGLSPAPAQAADVSRTGDRVDGVVTPPEQITSLCDPCFTEPPDLLFMAQQQRVDPDGDGQDEAWFRAVRVWISPDDGLALGTLALVDAEQASYEFGADWGRVILDDDGIPISISLGGEGQKTALDGKIQPFTYQAVIRRGAGARTDVDGAVTHGPFSFDFAIAGPSPEAIGFEAEGGSSPFPDSVRMSLTFSETQQLWGHQKTLLCGSGYPEIQTEISRKVGPHNSELGRVGNCSG